MPKKVSGLLFLCCVVLCGAAARSAVPIEQEPAHRLVLQNAHVRVFEIWLPPGETTLWHVHRHNGISVRLADARIEDQPHDGQAKMMQLRRGAVAYGAVPTALTHLVRNVGETAFHNIYVELLPGHDGEIAHAVAGSDRRLEFENERVRTLRLTLAPGEVTAMHTHASSGVAVLLTESSLEISGPVGAARTVELKAGAVQWSDAGTTHMLKNVGNAPIEMVDIELK